MEIIKIQNLSKVFNTKHINTFAINKISFVIKEKEFICIMGPSGCGKTTLLNILGFLEASTSGKYFFLEQDVSDYSESKLTHLRKSNVGFIFQDFNLIDSLNVFDNISLPLIYSGIKRKERETRINKIMKKLKISHRSRHFPSQLSGGQQQRVAIARAIAINPTLILADEPTGNLDSKNGIEVMELLSDLNKDGTTIIMVSHSKRDATFANRLINMLDGIII